MKTSSKHSTVGTVHVGPSFACKVRQALSEKCVFYTKEEEEDPVIHALIRQQLFNRLLRLCTYTTPLHFAILCLCTLIVFNYF